MPGHATSRFAFFLALAAPTAWSLAARAQSAPAAAPPAAASSAPATAATTPPPAPAPAPTSGSLLPPTASSTATSTVPAIDPQGDRQHLSDVGASAVRPPIDPSLVRDRPDEIYTEDWWTHTRPIFEIHGYFRTRAELFQNFSLGRHDNVGVPANGSNAVLWPQPLDSSYTDVNTSPHAVALCGGSNNCSDKTQASANMRFRMNPELHISDNLQILSQVDALDNLVLGSTPDAYAINPTQRTVSSASSTYNPYAALGVLSTTQGPPTAGVNGFKNSIDVKRAWAEYSTPVGQIRFGRMPDQWGLGMVHNAGDGIDSDYQSNIDRIMFMTGVRSLDLYFGGAWDFISSGPTNGSPYDIYGGQPYNTGNLTNVNQWSLWVVHKMNPSLQKLALTRGELVLNGGIYATYRTQVLDVDSNSALVDANGNAYGSDSTTTTNNSLVSRGAYIFTPDLWLQALYKKFRFEAEFATNYGFIENPPTPLPNQQTEIRQYGLATQTELKAIEDKLKLDFGFGWSSGDPWVQGLRASTSNGLANELNGGGPISTFAFHPDYRVDLIFFRHLLGQVTGAYYFRPSVDYDFLRDANGQKVGGGVALIWSRASQFEQAPGHKRDLGVEIDAQLYYQAKDGTLNDDPNKIGGFFAMLQGGIFFPLGGLGYLSGQQAATGTSPSLPNLDTSNAYTLRMFLGVAY